LGVTRRPASDETETGWHQHRSQEANPFSGLVNGTRLTSPPGFFKESAFEKPTTHQTLDSMCLCRRARKSQRGKASAGWLVTKSEAMWMFVSLQGFAPTGRMSGACLSFNVVKALQTLDRWQLSQPAAVRRVKVPHVLCGRLWR